MAEMKIITGGVCAAKGFKASGIHCGIRKSRTKRDLALIFSEVPASCAAVYTTNLAYDSCGGHNDVIRLDIQCIGGQCAHLLGNLYAVRIAGVGVAAVADNRLCNAVADIGLGDLERGALDQVRGVDRSTGGRNLGEDQCKISLGS